MDGACFFEGSCASGTVPLPAPFFGVHWFAPAGLFVSSHSYLNRLLKKWLLHFVGVCGPCDFKAAADGVSAKPFAKFILPPKALIVDFGTLLVRGPRGRREPRRRGSCRRCAHRQSVRRFLRHSSPCGEMFRECLWLPRSDRAFRWDLPGFT